MSDNLYILMILIINKMARVSRKTRQKELLLNHMNKLKHYFTAEELFSSIRKEQKGVGIATIYRFLADLKKKKQLHSYSCNKKSIYSRDDHHHCHFVCEECGKTQHFTASSLDFLQKSVRGSICHIQIDVHGICESCQKRGTK